MNLVEVRNNNATTTSRQVANFFGKEHSKVLRAIENLECDSEFTEANFGLSTYQDESGKKNKEYIITRDGFTILAMGFTGKKAMEFKLKYIKAFNEMERMIIERGTPQWQMTRLQGKVVRREETDVIKLLVEYAKNQGSKNAQMLYMAYSKLANSIAGVKKRDEAGIIELNRLSMIEHIILNVILQGMECGKHYKEIYQDSKAALNNFMVSAYLV